MFINIGNKRVNISAISHYIPKNRYKRTREGSHFIIEMIYIGGEKEEIFFNEEEERDSWMERMDKLAGLREV